VVAVVVGGQGISGAIRTSEAEDQDQRTSEAEE